MAKTDRETGETGRQADRETGRQGLRIAAQQKDARRMQQVEIVCPRHGNKDNLPDCGYEWGSQWSPQGSAQWGKSSALTMPANRSVSRVKQSIRYR